MDKPKKSEGAAVRVAMEGPSLDADQTIEFIKARNDEDRRRSSSAGESREKFKAFEDETGVEGGALSAARQILKLADKDNGQAKAMDRIMSLEILLPIIKAEVSGMGTKPMDFDPPPAAKEAAAKAKPKKPASNVVPMAPITQLADMPEDPGDDDFLAPTEEAAE